MLGFDVASGRSREDADSARIIVRPGERFVRRNVDEQMRCVGARELRRLTQDCSETLDRGEVFGDSPPGKAIFRSRTSHSLDALAPRSKIESRLFVTTATNWRKGQSSRSSRNRSANKRIIPTLISGTPDSNE